MSNRWLALRCKEYIQGTPVLPWSFETEYPDEAQFWMQNYSYVCPLTLNGYFVLIRREAFV